MKKYALGWSQLRQQEQQKVWEAKMKRVEAIAVLIHVVGFWFLLLDKII